MFFSPPHLAFRQSVTLFFHKIHDLTLSFSPLKEYFNQVVGPIKRATLTYGPDGRSRGVATVEFVKSDDAATAAQKYNGVPVDNKPMKVCYHTGFSALKPC